MLADSEAVSGRLAKPAKRGRRELTPVQRALALLVRREHSRKELARKLEERGIERSAASAAIDRLAAEGWQSDARFAEMIVRTRANHGQGPVRIRAELAMHGLDADLIHKALQSFEGQWDEAARDLAIRRFGPSLGCADSASLRKMADFLYRRGFDGSAVKAALAASSED